MNTFHTLLTLLIVSYSLVILAIDYSLPLGISTGTLYIVVIFAVSFIVKSNRILYLSTVFCCGLIVLGYFISPIEYTNHYALINRIKDIVILLIASLMGSANIAFRKRDDANKLLFIEAMNAAPMAIALIDENQKLLFSNRAMNSLFLYEQGDVLNRKLSDLIKENPKYQQSVANEDQYGYPQYIGITSSQQDFPLHYAVTPIHTEKGDIEVLVIKDLIEQQRREDKLNEEITEKKMFSFSLSHDFRGFLRRIGSFTSILKSKINNGNIDDNIEYLDIIEGECLKALSLVEDLSLYIKSGVQDGHMVEVKLQDILNSICDDNSDLINERTTNIEYTNLPTIIGIKSKIYLLFMNLITNAIKHNDDGVTIEITATQQKNKLRIVVADNGEGIEPKVIDKIFMAFSKHHKTGSISGSGLGLAIARNIVEQHNGKIWVESTIGEGTQFYIELPAIIEKLKD